MQIKVPEQVVARMVMRRRMEKTKGVVDSRPWMIELILVAISRPAVLFNRTMIIPLLMIIRRLKARPEMLFSRRVTAPTPLVS